MKFVIVPRRQDQWFWEIQGRQGNVIARSPGTFAGMTEAHAAIEAFRSELGAASVYDLLGARVGRKD